MAKPTQYVAHSPVGTFTRRSQRTYTHAVVTANESGSWTHAEWCGRRDLAEKLANRYRGGRTSWGAPFVGRVYVVEAKPLP